MRQLHQPALVLHARNYSETSLILEIFTARHGRLGLLAKGARRRSSPWLGILKPFQPLLLDWTGRSDLALLIGAENRGPALTLDVHALYCGFYLNELLTRLLHRHDPHEELFNSYESALHALASAAIPEIVLRIFEKRLLGEIGYGLVLDRDIVNNAPVNPDSVYEYVLDKGPVLAESAQALRALNAVRVRGESLVALAQENFTAPETLRDSKRLLRSALLRHLGERPLHSRRIYQHVLAVRSKINRTDETF
jgi:DNA repair protein RecO (recombination protein O)